jgi:uncharacterized protein
MSSPDAESACQYALQRLRDELSPDLYYHSLAHTQNDVVPATERLALAAGMSGDNLLLLRTAAWYHDLGFVEGRSDHEVASVIIAAAVLPGFGYSSDQIAAIRGMIIATRLPQNPKTRLEEILVDADLDSLGREDFLKTSLALRDELATSGTYLGLEDWYRRQLSFLQNHHYFTAEARRLRDLQKQKNIAHLQTLLSSM